VTGAAGPSAPRLGCVVIGRNEGERLRRCLASLPPGLRTVYVDSGSSDNSVATARAAQVEILELSAERPFTAARARNAGLGHLRSSPPGLAPAYVQLIDGDCEVLPAWFEAGVAALADPAIAVVCGRIVERDVSWSVYNHLCQLEWDWMAVAGGACGGNALVRAEAVDAVGGFDEELIAGEEADLCLRLGRSGYRVQHLPVPMVTHDAALSRFSQWWTRQVRAGFAYAEGAARHGTGPERHWVRERWRIVLFGVALPMVALGLALPTWGASLALLAAYPLLAARTCRRLRRDGWKSGDAALYAAFATLSRLPQAQGLLRSAIRRARGSEARLIEYKGG
jgi:GT2 family glycosyltransferase